MSKMPMKVCQLIITGVDVLGDDYRKGKMLYGEVLESRDIVCGVVAEHGYNVDRTSICDLFDREFELQYRNGLEE